MKIQNYVVHLNYIVIPTTKEEESPTIIGWLFFFWRAGWCRGDSSVVPPSEWRWAVREDNQQPVKSQIFKQSIMMEYLE